ncbi:hypothetical protein IFM89_005415 [Coptis chinensis]|uniref:Translocase of chloroplast n=1 Tax=Coptis chinensis TaxID=261450 RepID=A0A835M928_9MAGN|nr:hypothetical protein IFM89_005415 [Coptis chinensis]
MASPLIREWAGIQQFPEATQTKLVNILGKLKQENVSSLTILVMGKGGVGKSSTVNSLIGERVVAVSSFQSEGPRPVMVSRSRAGFTLNVIDTPGLIEGGYVNDQALDIIKRFLLNKTIDVLLYVDRMDAYRVDNLDMQVIKAITDSFGKAIWRRSLVVLTHGQVSPPDGLSYDDFLSRRSDTLLKVVRSGARFKKHELKKKLLKLIEEDEKRCIEENRVVEPTEESGSEDDISNSEGDHVDLSCSEEDSEIPVALAENSGRCQTNEDDEKVLPNGTAWIPHLVEMITEVVLNGSKSILVDKNLIEGPNPNEKNKFLIPLILAVQYFFVMKPIQQSIRGDISKEDKPLWELRDMGSGARRF